jgi:hypothetical protein
VLPTVSASTDRAEIATPDIRPLNSMEPIAIQFDPFEMQVLRGPGEIGTFDKSFITDRILYSFRAHAGETSPQHATLYPASKTSSAVGSPEGIHQRRWQFVNEIQVVGEKDLPIFFPFQRLELSQ